jgi:hypothetical protein
MLATNFHKLIKSLPRLIRDPDDTNKSLNLRLLNGYIQLLRAHIKTILTSFLPRISLTLLQILEFDDSSIRIVEQRRIVSFFETTPQNIQKDILNSDTGSIFYKRKSFKHFRDEKIIKEIVKTCRLLGLYGEPMNLIDHFVNLLRHNEHARKQSVFILNELVLGIAQCNQQIPSDDSKQQQQQQRKSLRQYIEYILTEYLNSEIWSPPIENRSNSIDKQNDYITLSCLLLEGISNFAQVIRHHFSISRSLMCKSSNCDI